MTIKEAVPEGTASIRNPNAYITSTSRINMNEIK